MTSSPIESAPVTATDVAVTGESLSARLDDGREISVPLAWYPRLLHATAKERQHWILQAEGRYIHWPHIDEDLSIEGLLAGRASAESESSLQNWLQARRSGTSLTLEAEQSSKSEGQAD